MKRRLTSLVRALIGAAALAPFVAAPAQAQMAVIDPSNLIQNALNAARALQQINNQVTQITNQIRQLENDASGWRWRNCSCRRRDCPRASARGSRQAWYPAHPSSRLARPRSTTRLVTFGGTGAARAR